MKENEGLVNFGSTLSLVAHWNLFEAEENTRFSKPMRRTTSFEGPQATHGFQERLPKQNKTRTCAQSTTSKSVSLLCVAMCKNPFSSAMASPVHSAGRNGRSSWTSQQAQIACNKFAEPLENHFIKLLFGVMLDPFSLCILCNPFRRNTIETYTVIYTYQYSQQANHWLCSIKNCYLYVYSRKNCAHLRALKTNSLLRITGLPGLLP